METGESLGVAFVILDESSEACGPCEGSLDDPSAWEQDKAAFGLGQFDDLEIDAVPGSGLRGAFAGIALVDLGDFDAVVGDGLNGSGECLDLAAILCAGRGDMQREQMAQRVDRDMKLGAILALGPVTPTAFATFRGGPQGPAVDDRRAWLSPTPRRQPQHDPQIVDQRFKASGSQPALRLLINRRPRWQVVRHPPPRRAGLHDIAQAAERFPINIGRSTIGA